MRCASCGESCRDRANFCPNCGAALRPAEGVRPQPQSGAVAKRRVAPVILSVLAVVGLVAVAISMSFIDDAPGDVGSPIAALFHAVGAIQLVIGLGVLVSAAFLAMRGLEARTWGNAILVLGAASVAALLVMAAEGTFAVIFLAVPGLMAIVAGLIARRAA